MIRTPWTFDEDRCFYSPFPIANWGPCDVVVEGVADTPRDDFPGTTWGSPIVSERAAKELGSLCGSMLQFLPLRCFDKLRGVINEKYYLMIVLCKVDCLDFPRSMRFFGGSWSPRNRVIRPDLIPSGPIVFRVQGLHSFVVVDNVVRQTILDKGLTGVHFWEVCQSGDNDAPDEEEVPAEAIDKYRTQWERLPRFHGWASNNSWHCPVMARSLGHCASESKFLN